MTGSPPIALIDACVFFSATLRDIVLSLAVRRIFLCKWTCRIEQEWTESLIKKLPQCKPEKIWNIARQMRQAIIDWEVSGFSDQLDLPDPEDTHVLAAAIHSNSDYLVTLNTGDFSGSEQQGFRGQVVTVDEFISILFRYHSPLGVEETLRSLPNKYKSPPLTPNEWLTRLRNHELHRTAELLQ